jgi:ribosome-associated toxin RatA of RatAB toxin-antitoxin module
MAPLAQAADVAVQVVRNGEAFDVEASAELEADPVQAWAALTDYDRLSEFIPGMNESRVVSRDGNNVIVDQSGEARLLFFTFPMRVRLAIVEQAFDRIDSRAIDGNFKELTGTYHIETLEARLLLRYSGSMTPDFAVPPLIGTLLVRNIVTQRFRAMVEEILRRQPEEPDQPLPAQP